MDKDQLLVIGLFGFGVVGEGLYKVLQQTPSLNARIKRICIKNPGKPRLAPAELFTTDKDALLNDPEINVIVEVISDSEAGFQIVTTAMRNGKSVVSAGKKMIAEHFLELLELQRDTGVSFLYEAAAGASIPIIRNLEEYYDNDLLHAMRAIVNGSTNYILTKMFEQDMEYVAALKQAQQLGFAESDPSLDTSGGDAAHKWTFLLSHGYGIIPNSNELLFAGIENINTADAIVAKQKKYCIRLVAQARKLGNGAVAAFVLPQFVTEADPLSFVKDEYNGVLVESSFSDKQFFYGKGAGSFPTASAVLSDLSALRYRYKYEYKKLNHHSPLSLTHDFFIRVYIRFDDIKQVPKEKFAFIEEWHYDHDQQYMVGVLPFNDLVESGWWRKKELSLIVMPDAIVEDMDVRRIKEHSLKLAGITQYNFINNLYG